MLIQRFLPAEGVVTSLFFSKIMSQLYGTFYPPHVGESKTVLNCGFQLLDSRFFVSRYWPGFQSSLELQIPCAVFRFPKPRIPDSKSENSRIVDCTSRIFLDSGNPILLHEVI